MKNHLRCISTGIALLLFLSVWAPGVLAQRVDEETRQEFEAVKALLEKEANAPRTQSPVSGPGKADMQAPAALQKTSALIRERKSFIMNGNKVLVEVFDYGGIGPGYNLVRGATNLVWRNACYVFQFGPLVGASVPNPADTSRRIHIISDGLYDYPSLLSVSPSGDTLWQFQPIAGYSEAGQPRMASNPAPDADGDGKPDSWPRTWYNPMTGKYVWPGYLSQDIPSADLEVLWAMDDRDNAQYQYYPFVSDSSRRGLGIRIDGRGFQWSNALAENTIFFVYTITNVSDKDLDSVVFGIYGDPDVGMQYTNSANNKDDWGKFVPPYSTPDVNVDNIPPYARSVVYFWDPDMLADYNIPLGFLGCKFLESPGNPNDGIDNDGDGMIDERQDDGIDNDNDWNPLTDDVGLDGVAGTNDAGEGNGVPDAGLKLPDGSLDPLFPGEPNFELTDLDEADQIGLTSFNSWTWNTDQVKNDESMWTRTRPREFSRIQQNADIVFIFGSGYISLKKGETKRISMALILGENLDDLLTSAKTVQTIYNQNYRFFRPPVTPRMAAVPGDKKVTLYWDTKAEESVDPITAKDFEGYVIYRSTDPSFTDIQQVTDGRGSQFLYEPLKDAYGNEAKWDVDKRDEPFTDLNGNEKYDAGEPYSDLNGDRAWSPQIADWWKGYHPVPYQDRGVQYYLGNNSGLVHSYVDSNAVINGQTYYYAVVAYDHGDTVGIPPTETTKKITLDPITSQLLFDRNTAQVIPGPRASGYGAPTITNRNVVHESGISTGKVEFSVMNDLRIPEGGEYVMSFDDTVTTGTRPVAAKNYSVLDVRPVTESFALFDTNYAQLKNAPIADDAFLKVADRQGAVFTRGVDFILNSQRGTIRRTSTGMRTDSVFLITYRYYPVFQSQVLKGGDSNPVFDGVKLTVVDEDQLAYDSTKSGWKPGSRTTMLYKAQLPTLGARKRLYPADYEIEFSSGTLDSAYTLGTGGFIRVPVPYRARMVTGGVPVPLITYLGEPINATRNRRWDPGEEISLFKPGSTAPTDTLTWAIIVRKLADSLVVSPSDTTLPADGDVLYIATTRPFMLEDTYRLRTEAGRVDAQLASTKLDNIYVVPNPYVGVNEIEPANRLPGATRGERRIYFENLPPKCTIRVFTISGDLVQTLEHDSGVANGREFWNLLNRDGFSIAYGVYVAHIDAPGIGEKIIKFAIIK